MPSQRVYQLHRLLYSVLNWPILHYSVFYHTDLNNIVSHRLFDNYLLSRHRPMVATGSYSGLLKIWDYEKKLVTLIIGNSLHMTSSQGIREDAVVQ